MSLTRPVSHATSEARSLYGLAHYVTVNRVGSSGWLGSVIYFRETKTFRLQCATACAW